MLQIIIDLKDRQKYPAWKMALGVPTSAMWSAKVWNHYNYKAANSSNSCYHAQPYVSYPFIRSIVHSVIHSSTRSSSHSFTHSLIHASIPVFEFVHLFTYLFIFGHLDYWSRSKYHFLFCLIVFVSVSLRPPFFLWFEWKSFFFC